MRPQPTLAAILAATLLGNLTLLVSSALLGLLATVTGPLPPPRAWPRRVARLWSRVLVWSSGVRLVVSRSAEVESGGSYVLMPNHTSLMDIPVLLASSDLPLCFVAKKQLFRFPLFGWGMRAAGYIAVDREDRRQAAEVLQQAGERLQDGDTVVIFPEETRSPGGRLLPFQRGGFLLAMKSKRQIVPVGIRGSGSVRRRGGLLVRPGKVEVHYGAPIDPSGGLRRKGDLMAETQRRVAELAAVALPEPDAPAH